jgi:hypothetical protein
MKFRKKPIIIDALQFETNNEAGAPNMNKIVVWIEENGGKAYHDFTNIFIETLEGTMKGCSPKDVYGILAAPPSPPRSEETK